MQLIKKTVKKFLSVHRKNKFNVSIAFIGDTAMCALNKTYRKKDKTTDVLSFPSATFETDSSMDNFLGEIIINYAQIKRQAKKYQNSLKQELIYILTHGLLHLVGYEDETEQGRKKMERLGDEFVKNRF